MNIYTEHLTFQTQEKREFINITEHVKSALHKSGFHDGIILVAALHSNSAIVVNDEEAGLLQDVTQWMDQLCPPDTGYKHQGHFESTAEAHLKSILLNPNTTIGFSEGSSNLARGSSFIMSSSMASVPSACWSKSSVNSLALLCKSVSLQSRKYF